MNHSIYVVEQSGSVQEPFNRAKLFNVGVVEGILKEPGCEDAQETNRQKRYCIILHDVDMLPVR